MTVDALSLFAQHRDEVLAQHPALTDRPGKRLLFETLRRMLSVLLGDLVAQTQAAVDEQRVRDMDDVPLAPPLARLSPALRVQSDQLKRFLKKVFERRRQREAQGQP